MNILFIGTTGVHHTLVAAYQYLGRLNTRDYRLLNNFNNAAVENSGYPIFVGTDDKGNRVFSVGVGKDLPMVKKTLDQLAIILGFSDQDLMIRPLTLKGDNIIWLLQQMSRILPVHFLTGPLISYIMQHDMPNLLEQVRQIRHCI